MKRSEVQASFEVAGTVQRRTDALGFPGWRLIQNVGLKFTCYSSRGKKRQEGIGGGDG